MNHSAAAGLVVLLTACAHRPPLVEPARAHAGCYVLEWSAASPPPPGFFPDTLRLAAEWFLPADSTGARLRVVRPRDASLATYRTYGGRFWWFNRPDSLVVEKSDGVRGVRLAAHVGADGFTGEARVFGPADRDTVALEVRGHRISCR